MQKLLTGCWLLVSLSLLAACATTTSGLGEDAGNASLPTGATLLDSDKDRCDGTLEVGNETIDDDGLGLRAQLFVEPGENATFEFEDDHNEIEWACIEGPSPDVESKRCPEEATHVRLTRATTGGELLVECYGRAAY